MLCAQRDRALTLTTQWPQSWLPLKTAWLMVMVDLSWHLSEHRRAHTQIHTPARLGSHEREAHQSFHCADISFLNTHKSFLHFHIRALYQSLCSTHCIGAPPRREHSSWWKSSRLKRHSLLLKLETVCLSGPPSLYRASLTFSCHWSTAKKQKKKNVYAGMSFHEKLIKLSRTFFGVCVSCQQWTKTAGRWGEKTADSTEQSNK